MGAMLKSPAFRNMFFLVIISVLISGAICQNSTAQFTDSSVSTTQTSPVITSTTEPPKNTSCSAFHNDCKACVANSDCYYCDTNKACGNLLGKFVPSHECKLKDAHIRTCRFNYLVMIIVLCVLILIATIIIITICCYCCCKKKGVKLSKDDIKWSRQREERKQIAAEKRKERSERTEEIRRKYGLVKDSNPYQKFDA